MELLWTLGILVLCPIATLQQSTVASPTYVGAVVEYNPIKESRDGKSRPDLNAENYKSIAEKAQEISRKVLSKSVDILVFPESSLSMSQDEMYMNDPEGSHSEGASYIPAPEDKVVPCVDLKDKYTDYLKKISCIARNQYMYIVVNHREKVDCVKGSHGCPNDGLLIYNTNVAFDRDGQVVARYRKYNLFGEIGVNITSEPIPSTFETDFGVTFGQFICFDILFETPTLNLTRNLGITDIIFSTHWFSELPYLYAVEVQAAWAYANNVNMLAAGYNNPQTASGGSGIYIGREGYTKVVSEDKASNILLVSEIPKVVNGTRVQKVNNEKTTFYEFNKTEIETSETEHSGIYLHSTDDLSPPLTMTVLVSIKNNISFTYNLCDLWGFCCEFKYVTEFNATLAENNQNKYYRYRLALFNGTRNVKYNEFRKFGVQSCGIIHCVNESLSSCGELINNKNLVFPMTFHSIEISLKNMKSERALFMPVTLSTSMLPLNTNDFSYEYTNSEGSYNYSMTLKQPKKDLLTFGIYGRNFEKDTEITKPSSASTNSLIFPLMVVLLLANFLK